MGQKKGKPHPTKSFEQLVGRANQEALKPYILEVFGDLANDLSKRVFTRMGILANRVEALEIVLKDRLGVTQAEIDGVLFDLEDKVSGYQKVDRPAKEGDLVRLGMRIKSVQTGYGKQTKKEFANLGLPPHALGLPMFEKALIGAVVHQVVVVPLDAELQKQTGTEEIEFTIDRISEIVPKPEAKKEEAPNAEGQDAQKPVGSPEAGKTDQA